VIGNPALAVVLGDNVKTIGKLAFSYGNLNSITWGRNVTTIGESAFANNPLTSVDIPDTVTSLGARAFESNQLAHATMPSRFTRTGGYIFYKNQLTSFNLPHNIEEIGTYVLADNKLESITIPNTVRYIWDGAFANNRLTSVEIPDSVRTIRGFAFTGNPLTSIKIGAGVAVGDGSIAAFDNDFDVDYRATGSAAGTYIWYPAESVWSITPPPPTLGGTVSITSSATTGYTKFYEGVTLTANTGGVTGVSGSPSYMWRVNGTETSGETYLVKPADKEAEVSVTVSYSNGSLTSAPVKIHRGTPISDLAGITQNGDYILTGNTSVSGPKYFGIDDYFTGTFDGNGYTITLTITSSLGEIGLFSGIESGGEVRNLGLKGSITVPSGGTLYVGAVAGENKGTIENVSSSVTIEVRDNSVNAQAGGIAGYTNSDGSTIRNCYSTGKVTVNGKFTVSAGGIVGNLGGLSVPELGSTVEYCWASGNISTSMASTEQCVGGIAGNAFSGNFLTNCAALNTDVKTNGSSDTLQMGRIAGYDPAYQDGYSGVEDNYANSGLPPGDPPNGNDGDPIPLTATQAPNGTWWSSATNIDWSSVWGGADATKPWKWPETGNRPILFFETEVNQ
jgi:hypothetical protein